MTIQNRGPLTSTTRDTESRIWRSGGLGLPVSLCILVAALSSRCDKPGKECTKDEDCGPNAVCNREVNLCVSTLADDGGSLVPVISTESVREGIVGAAYEEFLSASGGAGGYSWTLLNPPPSLSWVSLDAATGRLWGTPLAALQPAVSLTVQVKDAASRVGEKAFKLSVRNCVEGESVPCAVAMQSACFTGAQACQAGTLGACVLGGLSTDIAHCGPDCRACSSASDRCRDGLCHCGVGNPCSGATPNCCSLDAGTLCVDTRQNPDFCGQCGTSCDTDRNHVRRACDAGTCEYPCAPNFGRCPATARSCDTDITTPENCGICGRRCSAPDAGFASCDGGNCAMSCSPGAQLCSPNTCYPLNDVNHCGNCSHQCPPPPAEGWETCNSGQCAPACPDGGFSGLICSNHCIRSDDLNNCGGCGQVCAIVGGVAACINGQCLRQCTVGFNVCQVGSAWQCISNSDLNNCGGCGRVCAISGGTPNCSDGTCYRSCPPGFNACQVGSGWQCISNTDLNNCGGCGQVCAISGGTANCNDGNCHRSCPGGYNACPEGIGWRCIDNNDHDHCGSCNNVCLDFQQCINGVCINCPPCGAGVCCPPHQCRNEEGTFICE